MQNLRRTLGAFSIASGALSGAVTGGINAITTLSLHERQTSDKNQATQLKHTNSVIASAFALQERFRNMSDYGTGKT